MEQVLLGRQTGLRVSALALGTGRLGTDRDGGFDPGQARGVLERFAEAGGTFIDTSSVYGLGQAETTLGEFLGGAGRDRFVVASKYGLTAQASPSAAEVGSHRRAMRLEVEGSLRRLRTDRIDVYMPHLDDGVTPVAEIMAGLDDLVRAGKVLHVGLTNLPAWRAASAAMLADLRGLAPLAVLQLQYSLAEREAEREHLPLARSRGLGVMGYSPLAGGALAARLRARAPGQATDANDADPLADAVLGVARAHGREPDAVALAWVRAKGIVPIIGPRGPDQLAASLAATDLALSLEDVATLDAASQPRLGHPYDLLASLRAQLGLAVPWAGVVL